MATTWEKGRRRRLVWHGKDLDFEGWSWIVESERTRDGNGFGV
jgi:hypothetical protein